MTKRHTVMCCLLYFNSIYFNIFYFSLPIIQRILTNPNSRAIIVCPSRELCAQTYQFLKILTERCSDFISLYELGNETESDDVIGASIVLGTPGRLVKAIKGNRLVMKDVAALVLDEGTDKKAHIEIMFIHRPL